MQAIRPGRTIPVAVAIDDAALRRALLVALEAHPVLHRAGADEDPAVMLTDAPDMESRAPVVLVGAAASAARFAAVVDPDHGVPLLLAAAHLAAAGFRIERAGRPRGGAFDAPGDGAMRSHLSPREIQVLELLVDGASNKLVARRLGISVHTAKFHVAAVIDKLGASNRSDAVAIAFRDGYLSL